MPEHTVELYRLRGGKYMVDFRPARQRSWQYSGASHISIMMQTDWLNTIVSGFLDAPGGN